MAHKIDNERNEQPLPFDGYERVRFGLLPQLKQNEINETFGEDETIEAHDYVLICDFTGMVILEKVAKELYFTIAGRESELGSLKDCIQLLKDHY